MSILSILLFLVILGYIFLLYNVSAISKKPVKYAHDLISKDPVGKTVYLEQADGAKIRAIVNGTGPTIVFAHGYGASLVEWNIIGDHLVEEGYQIIAFDQLGHGESTIGSEGISSASMASAYKTVLEHFDVSDGILVGHSMGGFLGILTLLNEKELVKKRLRSAMIMASFAGDILKDNAQNKVQIPMISSGIMTFIANTKLLGYPFGTSLLGDEPDAAMIDVFLKVFVDTNHKPLIPILKAFGDESYYNRLNEISIPCTIIVGEKDKTTPAFHTDDMVASIANTKLVKIPGKGHMLNWEAADEVIKEIKLLAQPQKSKTA